VFLINPLFPQEKTMNEINTTAIEATTVAAQTTTGAIASLMSSKTGRYAAIATGVAVASYLAYIGGKKIGAALAARKAAKAAN
jgi:recombinational DNA repair protein RecR